MKKVYISCYNNNDREYKNKLISLNKERNNTIFELIKSETKQYISLDPKQDGFTKWIKNKYLRDSEVLILLVGLETKNRKHIDWEVRAIMEENALYKKGGIMIVYLDDVVNKYGNRIPRSVLPKVLAENFGTQTAFFVETTWEKLTQNYSMLEKLIDVTYGFGKMSDYIINNDIQIKDESNVKFIY